MILKGVTNFERKLICDLKNDTRNLVNFHASSRKPENSQFDRILLSKAYKDLDEKAQKSCLMILKSDARFEKKTDTWFQKF